jgi:hypothetical protein
MTNDTLMVHSVSGSLANNAARYSHNTIQGHHHGLFGILYYADMNQLRWSMSVGCLLDTNSPAARYGAGQVLKRPILGSGVVISDKQPNRLVISDLHIPYHHCDSFDFLSAIKKEFKCTEVLNVGDMLDHHAGSYHEAEPDALDPESEYYAAQKYGRELQSIFPQMIITQGNHDKIPQRKLKTVGLPSSMVSDYNALYGFKDGWQWVDQHKFDSGQGKPSVVPMTLNKRGRWDKLVKAR